MKPPDKFVIPGRLGIWRIRQREGPPIVWLAHRTDILSSRFFSCIQELVKWTSFPETSIPADDIKEWIAEFNPQEPAPEHTDEFQQQITQEGFGPPPGDE